MLLALVATPFLGALLPFLFARAGRLWPAWLAGATAVTGLVLLAGLWGRVFAGEVIVERWQWLPQAGLELALRMDGLGLLFTTLILGIGLLVVLYARYYLPADRPLGRFYTLLLLFMGAMLGVVLSENLLVMLVFWELTSLTSFFLISYLHDDYHARRSARMALTVTGAGGLALLGGILLLGEMVGSYDVSTVIAAGDLIRGHDLYIPALLLVLLGVFTKSAQFPFHFWLPRAMAAPTPVSAYLHSATMVKAGVFLLARLHPALAGTDTWFFLVGGAGLLTFTYGAFTAIFQHDIKGLLAYSTISHLGLITLLFGFGTPLGAVAGVFHIINHATFKASLFMAAGIIDHETGSRDMRRINGLFRYMPHTAVLAMVAALAMAGVPLLNGFLSKEMFFAETLHQQWLGEWTWVLPVVATAAGIFSMAYSLRFIHDVFFNGEPVNLDRTPHEPPRWMKIPVEVLVGLCLLVGVLPAVIIGPLLEVSAGAVVPSGLPDYSLAIWHGLNFPLLMSVIAMLGGIALYGLRFRLFALYDRLPHGDGEAAFEAAVNGVARVARTIVDGGDGGGLQRYLFVFFAAAVVAGLLAVVQQPPALFGDRELLPVDAAGIAAVLALALGAAATVAMHRRRLVAIVVIGIVGLVVSLLFVRFSAPDLALTQLSVEVVTIILLLLALYFLPQETEPESAVWQRGRDAVLALAAGVAATLAALTMLTGTGDPISHYFLENAVPGGGGHNVVNVILVDFRGFDTFGEILVLAIAALGIHAMLQGLQLRVPATGPGGRPWSKERHPLFLAMLARPLLPLALLVAIYLFLRGHNAPGGGFIAGLVAAIALILQHLANGLEWTRQRVEMDYHRLFALGAVLAAGTGLASWAFGYPFLTSTFAHVHLPWGEDMELASALVFDLGVFITVIASVLLILAELGRLGDEDAPAHHTIGKEG